MLLRVLPTVAFKTLIWLKCFLNKLTFFPLSLTVNLSVKSTVFQRTQTDSEQQLLTWSDTQPTGGGSPQECLCVYDLFSYVWQGMHLRVLCYQTFKGLCLTWQFGNYVPVVKHSASSVDKKTQSQWIFFTRIIVIIVITVVTCKNAEKQREGNIQKKKTKLIHIGEYIHIGEWVL